VLVRTVASREISVAVNDPARARAIRPGMTLSEARALFGTVIHAEHDPSRDAIGLEALARWMMRFSPVVAMVEMGSGEWGVGSKKLAPHSPHHTPHGLSLDITGCDRVFGGLNRIIEHVAGALTRMGISARLAIAPTPGAAWAMTMGNSDDARIVTADE